MKLTSCILLIIGINLNILAQFPITGDFSHAESFEAGIPSTWTTDTGGSLSIFTNRYKHGNQSIQWTWTNSSNKLTVTDPNLIANSNQNNSGIKFWVYSQQDIQDSIQFVFYDAANTVLCSFYYRINFDGWRTQWINYKSDLDKNSSTIIDRLEIISPVNISSGTLWFDLVEYPSTIEWDRGASHQFDKPIEIDPGTAPARWLRNRTNELRYTDGPKLAMLPTSITSSMNDDVNTIAQRIEDYLLGTEAFINDPIYINHYNEIQNGLVDVHSTFLALNITEGPNGELSGIPIFGTMPRSQYPYGPNVNDVVSLAYNLVLDYRLNNNLQSKTDFVLLMDYLHDQGWSPGSSQGSLYFIENSTLHFTYACFLMRNELALEAWGAKTKLDRAVELIFWYADVHSLFADLDDPVKFNSDDIFRSYAQSFITFFMMDNNDVNKYWYLKQFTTRFEQLILVPINGIGLDETLIRPDYIGYHHSGPAMNTYFKSAVYSITLQAKWLNGTQYAYNANTKATIKKLALTLRSISQQYDFPKGMSMRWSGKTYGSNIPQILAATTYAVSSGTTPDPEVAAAFMRLWNPSNSEMKLHLNYLGDIETELLIINDGSFSAENLSQFKIHPFASLASWHHDNWLVSTKGYSEYVWNTEMCCSRNKHGGFDSNGQLSILLENNNGSSYDISGINYGDGYDWKFIPGATTVDISITALDNFDYWEMQSSSFVGGVTHKGSNGIWAMELDDNVNIIGNQFKKSVFYFEPNIMVALSNGIKNSNTENTVSTLFQLKIDDTNPANQPIQVNGNSIPSFPYYENNFTGSVTLKDPYGNAYYIPDATDLVVDRQNQNSYHIHNSSSTNGNWSKAYLNHGISPTNASYEYATLIQAEDSEIAAFASNPPYEVLRNDNIAHIVKYNPDEQTGYVIFDENIIFSDNTGLLRTTSIPLIMMIDEINEDYIQVSVADPELLPPGQTSSFEIRGRWEVLTNLPELTSFIQTDSTTTFTLNHKDGKSYFLDLKKSAGLPVELLSFNAILNKEKTVHLTWQTASENNNDYFSILRSADGNSWSEIYRIKGSGNSTVILNYETIDKKPILGLNYYQLKQTDFSGQFSYSDVRVVRLEKEKPKVVIYPNPTSSKIMITGDRTEVEFLKVYNMNGQELNHVISYVNQTSAIIDLSKLPIGNYIIETRTTTNKVQKHE